MKAALFLPVLLAVLSAASAQPAKPAEDEWKVEMKNDRDGWKIYTNPRFGTVVPVPPGMKAQRPPDNGGGQTFLDAETTALLTVWASFNIDNPGNVDDRWRTALIEPGRAITYKKKSESWFVISGTRDDGSAFYERYDADKKYCAGWLITYRQADEKKYSAIIDRIAKGYQAGLGKGSDKAD